MPLSIFEELKVQYKSGNIHYNVQGSGRTVVLLHGFLESSSMWDEYATRLSKSKRVITIDLPGHGQSDCFGYVHTMDFMAECVKTVLDELKIRKCVLIGHSMGGYVGLAFADMYPDYLKGLCLFFSTSREDSETKKLGRDQAIRLVKENHKSFIRKAIPQLFRPKNRVVYKEDINRLKNEALKTPQQGIIAALLGMKNRPDREIVIRFCPYNVLFVAGKYDQVLPYQDLIEQAKQSERAEFMLMEEIAHMGFIEAKEECYKALKRFSIQCFS